ncbi:enoyl-CoA hydratase-related protein [candidate division KSB1 bacterium]
MEKSLQFETLLCDIKDGIGTVTVNRPDKGNALNAQTMLDIMAAISQLKINNDVAAIIVTGAGEKFFVAGADINELIGHTAVTGTEFARQGQEIFMLIEQLGKPVIAAVNGYALGGGCELAMACTLRIASSNATFGQPEVGLGIIPGFGGTQRLPRLVGKGRATELLITGDMINAEEAFRIGLVNKVVDRSELMNEARKITHKILGNGPLAVKYCMEAVNHGLEITEEEGMHLEAHLFGISCATEDKNTGMKAFLEKSGKPEFQGK